MPNRLIRLGPLTALAAVFVASALPAPAVAAAPDGYARAVTQICAHARLFEGSHAVGTRAGAVELATDIRDTAERRLARVAALAAPREQQRPAARWLALERRLADVYALTYVRVWDLIAEPRTPAQRPRAARRLAGLMQSPAPLRRAAAHLERQLHVPDCTGG